MVEPLWLRVWAWVWSHQLNNFPLSGWFHVNCTLKVQTANKVIKHWHFNVFLFQQQHSYMQLQCNFSMQMKRKKIPRFDTPSFYVIQLSNFMSHILITATKATEKHLLCLSEAWFATRKSWVKSEFTQEVWQNEM